MGIISSLDSKDLSIRMWNISFVIICLLCGKMIIFWISWLNILFEYFHIQKHTFFPLLTFFRVATRTFEINMCLTFYFYWTALSTLLIPWSPLC